METSTVQKLVLIVNSMEIALALNSQINDDQNMRSLAIDSTVNTKSFKNNKFS